MMTKLRIYFAHTLKLRQKAVDELIPQLEKHFTVINPFANRLDAFEGLSEKEIRSNRKFVNPNWVVRHDILKINDSDGIIAYMMEGVSIGTTQEIVYGLLADLPVVAVVPEELEFHPWLQYHCVGVTDKLEEAVEAMVNYYE